METVFTKDDHSRVLEALQEAERLREFIAERAANWMHIQGSPAEVTTLRVADLRPVTSDSGSDFFEVLRPKGGDRHSGTTWARFHVPVAAVFQEDGEFTEYVRLKEKFEGFEQK